MVIRKVSDVGNRCDRFHASSLTDGAALLVWVSPVLLLFLLFLRCWRLAFDDLLCLTCVPGNVLHLCPIVDPSVFKAAGAASRWAGVW